MKKINKVHKIWPRSPLTLPKITKGSKIIFISENEQFILKNVDLEKEMLVPVPGHPSLFPE